MNETARNTDGNQGPPTCDRSVIAAEAAVAYAERGWRVFPLRHVREDGECSCGPGCEPKRRGKHPVPRSHGFKEATANPYVARVRWGTWPGANIGLATGAEYRLFVLDVDGHEGHATLAKLEHEHGQLGTLRARTGSGGEHLYFTMPEGVELGNRGKFAPGLDTRADGGYVLLPPSRNYFGSYEWLNPTAESQEMPAWLVDLVRRGSPKPTSAVTTSLSPPGVVAPGADRWALLELERAAQRVARTKPGERNDTLNRAAYRLGRLIGGGLLPFPLVYERLHAAGLACGLDEREVRAVLRVQKREG